MNRLIFLLLFLPAALPSHAEGSAGENGGDEASSYDMTGLCVQASCFDYFSCGFGFNAGGYSVSAGHYFALVYGGLVEYKTPAQVQARGYVRAYGGSGGMLLGLSGVVLTDFSRFSVGLSPEIGLGFGPLNLFYRYTFHIDPSFDCHEIVLVIYISLGGKGGVR